MVLVGDRARILGKLMPPMPEQLTVVATFNAKPGRSQELGQRLAALVRPARSEAGCVNYDLHQSTEDENVWMVYENWRSRADLDVHIQTPLLQALVKDLPDLTVDGLKLQFFSMASQRV
jgi:quinol monooxygenase YgiN